MPLTTTRVKSANKNYIFTISGPNPVSFSRLPVLLFTIGLFGLTIHASPFYEEQQLFFHKDMLKQDINKRVESKKRDLRNRAYEKSFGGIIKSGRTYPAKYEAAAWFARRH